MRSTFDADGYVIIDAVLNGEQCEEIASRLPPASLVRAGSRNLLHDACCAELALYLKNFTAIAEHLPATAVAVQCTLFDKSPARNWLVALHQDLSIPVRERIAHPNCTGWSEKEDVLYVQPPLSVLESLVAVRVHLDECGPGAGPLRVVPGSHRHGRLSGSEARHHRQTNGEFECFAKRGDALLMRPLLLHASSKATAPSRRRVLHFLFGPAELPHALRWDNAV
jgi:ectoine hydroxylase-related dioxygenase (phytanoyl-CoA dioxygenase family)